MSADLGDAAPSSEAESWIDELSEQGRDWYFIGLELQADGRLAQGADLLVRASCLDAGSTALREVAARAQFAAAQYLGSSVTFSAMVALNTRDDFARYASGICYARMGYFSEALANLNEAVKRRPDVERYVQALAVVQKVFDELEGEPVLMPSYCVPPLPIAPELLALELGSRPGPRPQPQTGAR